jgi:hypothetical protein
MRTSEEGCIIIATTKGQLEEENNNANTYN